MNVSKNEAEILGFDILTVGWNADFSEFVLLINNFLLREIILRDIPYAIRERVLLEVSICSL